MCIWLVPKTFDHEGTNPVDPFPPAFKILYDLVQFVKGNSYVCDDEYEFN